MKRALLLATAISALAVTQGFAQDSDADIIKETPAYIPFDDGSPNIKEFNEREAHERKFLESTTEVVVTALRRTEPLAKAPVSASVIKGEVAEQLELHDLKDIQTLTPSLIITSTANEAQTTARIRGVGTVGDNPGLESSVGVMIDGVMRARTATAMGDLGPIERIEVLKGPQSGLYGKGASAGMIAVLTKAPSNIYQRELAFTVGDHGTRGARLYVTGAVSDSVNGSLSFVHRSREGQYQIHTGEGPRTDRRDNNQNYIATRGQLMFVPNNKFTARLIADYSRRNEMCCSGTAVAIGGTRAYVDQLASDEGTASIVDPKSRQAWLNRPTDQVIVDQGISLEVAYDISDNLKLVTVSAHRDYDHRSGYDADFTSADIYYRDPDGSFGNELVTSSQEVRLEGHNHWLNFMVGLYADQEDVTRKDQYLYGPDYEPYMGLLLSSGANINRISELTGLGVGQSYRTGFGSNDRHEQRTRNIALYNNAEFFFGERFSVITNVRYNQQSKSVVSHYTNSDQGAACAGAKALSSPSLGVVCLPWSNPAFNDRYLIQENSEDATTGSLRLIYDLDHHMIYGAYSTGWKGAGFNLDREQLSNFDADTDTSFKSEHSKSYEIGYKYRRGPFGFEMAAYDQSFKNFQLNTFIGTTFLVRSVPHLKSKGVEIESRYGMPALGLNVTGAITYNESHFGPEAVAGLPLLANNTPSFAPRWSGVFNADWAKDMGDVTWRVNFNARHMSAYNTGSDLAPIKVQKAYSLYNGAVSVGAPDRSWELSLWGQNLSDELYYQVVFSAPFQSGSFDAFTGQPRTVGLTLTLRR